MTKKRAAMVLKSVYAPKMSACYQLLLSSCLLSRNNACFVKHCAACNSHALISGSKVMWSVSNIKLLRLRDWKSCVNLGKCFQCWADSSEMCLERSFPLRHLEPASSRLAVWPKLRAFIILSLLLLYLI